MKVFAIETEHSKIVEEYIDMTIEKMQSPNIVKNPFFGAITKLQQKGEKRVYVYSLRSVLPVEPPKYLMEIVIRKALRKQGYEGTFRLWSNDELLDFLLDKTGLREAIEKKWDNKK